MKIGHIFFASLFFVSFPVLAQVPNEGALDLIIRSYSDQVTTWEAGIAAAALWLFWALVGIDFIWSGIKLAIQGPELTDVVAEIVQRVMVYGFFLFLLQQGPSLAMIIVDSLTELGGIVGGPGATLNPSTVFDRGIETAASLYRDLSVWKLAASLPLLILALVIFVIFILIAAELIFVMVSLWIIVYGGMIVLAFGGSRWTQEYAINYLKTVLAIALKLFVLQLLIGVGMAIVDDWASKVDADGPITGTLALVGAVIVLYALVKGIGPLVESLISGHGAASASGSDAVVAGAAGAAGVAGGAAAAGQSLYGGGQALGAAHALAQAEKEAAGGESIMGNAMSGFGESIAGARGAAVGAAVGSALGHAGSVMGNLASSFGEDYSARARGDTGANFGTGGGRMASRMEDKKAAMGAGGGDDDSNYVSGVDPSIMRESDGSPTFPDSQSGDGGDSAGESGGGESGGTGDAVGEDAGLSGVTESATGAGADSNGGAAGTSFGGSSGAGVDPK